MIKYPKAPKRNNKKYLEWLKRQECCGPDCLGFVGDIIPAHQRILGRGGTGLKPPDFDALPLCFLCHHAEHKGSISFWGQEDKPSTKEYVQSLCDEHINRWINT